MTTSPGFYGRSIGDSGASRAREISETRNDIPEQFQQNALLLTGAGRADEIDRNVFGNGVGALKKMEIIGSPFDQTHGPVPDCDERF